MKAATQKTAIERAQEAIRKKRESGELERLDPVEKAHRNPKSLRLAINGKCWDCSCGQIKEIRECTIPDCTLYPVRPYK